MLEAPQYRFPIFRVYTLYAVVTICSIISTLILWLEDIESKDIKTSIVEYDINHSVFDVACVCFGQGLLMLALVAYLEHTTVNAATKGQNPPVAIFKAIGFILTFGAIVFNIVKGGIILDKYLNVDSQTLKFHNWYALCISCLVFSILQFAIYVKFLQHLKHLYGQFYVRMDNEEGEKSKENPKVNLRRLMTLTYPERWKLMVGTIGLIGSTGSQMVAPLFFGYVIQSAAYGTMDELNKQILYLFLIYLGGAIAAFFRAWMYTLAGQSIVARLRRDLFKQIVSQEVAFFDLNRTGELINRLSSDTQVIQNALSVNISMLLRYTLQIIGSVIIMLVTSPRLAGVLIAVIPVVGISAQRYGAYIRNQQKIFQDELAVAATNAEETISSLRTVRVFSQEPRMCKEYDDAIHKSYQAGEKLSLAGGWFNMFIGIVTQGTIVLVLWYGGKLVNEHKMNVGELTSFILYALNVAMAFAFLSSLYGDFMKAVGASVRIFELLDRKSEIVDGSIVVKSGKTDIDFDEVTFNYPSRPDNKVLTGLTFKMRPGETIALVGPSGGGKSTVINMLERFYDPLTGRVLLGGEDIKDVNLTLFRKKMSIVSQEPVLFAKTIGQNISFGIEASQVQIEEAAKQANAHEFIQEFEDGYNTNVGERGVKLSGGQKQRVAIARALLMNPDILLLDEATSALDAESEHLVQEAIDRAMVGRTVLVIAHRLSTVRDATRVMVINKGRIAEQGTHDELLAANGVYKKLVLRQLEKGPQLKEVDDDGDVSSEDLLENSD